MTHIYFSFGKEYVANKIRVFYFHKLSKYSTYKKIFKNNLEIFSNRNDICEF